MQHFKCFYTNSNLGLGPKDLICLEITSMHEANIEMSMKKNGRSCSAVLKYLEIHRRRMLVIAKLGIESLKVLLRQS